MPREEDPSISTMLICYIWLIEHRARMPEDAVMSYISIIGNDSLLKVRQWFSKNVKTSTKIEGISMQPISALENNVPADFRYDRRSCNRKGHNLESQNGQLISISRDPAKPYMYTSRCGASFANKYAWKKHEENKHPPRMWICKDEACVATQGKKGVFIRKDHFRDHLKKLHPNIKITQRHVVDCCKELKSNFDRSCVFKDCEESFESWDDRVDHIANHLKDAWHISQWRTPINGNSTSDLANSDSNNRMDPAAITNTSGDASDDVTEPSNTHVEEVSTMSTGGYGGEGGSGGVAAGYYSDFDSKNAYVSKGKSLDSVRQSYIIAYAYE